ncbi:MAG: hypothetical protein O9972_22820 [Burkholderiales bacterium]|nr:hypothetical protein [Burkholderiales bacterium]
MSIVAFPTADANLPDSGEAIFCQSGAAEGGALGFLHRQGYDLAGDVRPLVGDLGVMMHRHPPAVVAARMGLRAEFMQGWNGLGDTAMVDTLRALMPHGALRATGRRIEFYAASGA